MPGASVLIADDHLLLAETLAMYLQGADGCRVAIACSLPDALCRVRKAGPFDLVLLDLVMPGMRGTRGVASMVSANPGGSVVLMSGTANRAQVDEELRDGARGFVPKTFAPERISHALSILLRGQVFLPYDMLEPGEELALPAFAQLSPQEARILRLLCRGLSNKAIAHEVGLAEITVKTHMRTICAKMGVRNRTQAALIAAEGGAL